MQQLEEKRKAERITLDLNHFWFRGRGGQRGGEEEEKKEAKGKGKEEMLASEPTSMVVSFKSESI